MGGRPLALLGRFFCRQPALGVSQLSGLFVVLGVRGGVLLAEDTNDFAIELADVRAESDALLYGAYPPLKLVHLHPEARGKRTLPAARQHSPLDGHADRLGPFSAARLRAEPAGQQPD